MIISETGSKNGKLMKLLMDIDLGKPLLRGTRIKLDNEVVWADFKYEQLPTFCFYCGRVGHSDRLCEEKVRDSKDSNIHEGQYGEWLKMTGGSGGKRGTKPDLNSSGKGQTIIDKASGDEVRRDTARGVQEHNIESGGQVQSEREERDNLEEGQLAGNKRGTAEFQNDGEVGIQNGSQAGSVELIKPN